MSRKFKLANWTVDPEQCQLVCDSKILTLEPKAMSLLVVLAQAQGELVSRDRLFEVIWPNQHVSEHALNTLIASLRKSLTPLVESQSAENQSIIEKQLIVTRPKLGYRLSREVEWIEVKAADIDSTMPQKESKPENQLAMSNATMKKTLLLLGVFLAAILIYLAWFNKINPPSNTQDKPLLVKSNESSPIKVIRYLAKVTLSYSMSEKDKDGTPYCQNFNYEAMSKAVYKDNQWTIIGQYFTYKLNHTGPSLTNIEEVHEIEYSHGLGKEVDIMTVRLDAIGKLTGSADMSVFGESGQLLCEGRSLFVGSRIESSR